MTKFKYKAVDANDNVHFGEITAANYEGFLTKIYKLRLYPLEVTANGATEDKIDYLKNLKNKLSPTFVPHEIKPIDVKPPVAIDWYYIIISVLLAVIVYSAYVNS